MDPFVHLEVQSAFSFLWGTFTPEALVAAAQALGQPAVALTDLLGLPGAVRFCRAAEGAGIQPIVGSRLPLADGSWITLLARNRAGFGQLCRLVSAAHSQERRIVPLDPLLLAEGRDLIGLVGGWPSPWRRQLLAGGWHPVRAALVRLRRLFDQDLQLFLALEDHGLPEDGFLGQVFLELARDLDLPVVATNSVAFLTPADLSLHLTLVAVQERYHHRAVTPLPNDRFFLRSGAAMAEAVPVPAALANTRLVAERCQEPVLPLGRRHPPSYPARDGSARPGDTILARQGLVALARCQRPVSPVYLRQLAHELAQVSGRGLADFFLLVQEVVAFARKAGIRSSIRGSAAGSLLVHLLLGGPDPIRHGLLFERFMNEGRPDLPDIDIDFDSERRDEVLSWVMARLPGQAAMVATIHCLRPRSAVRLVARALGYPLAAIGRLADCLPWSLRGYDLVAALEALPELRRAPIRQEPRLLALASRLCGLPFQSSVHLGGVILAPGAITDWTPLTTSAKGLPVSQLDKDDVEALGLMKLDLLGLRMHSALGRAAAILRQHGIPVDLGRLPLDDAATYELLQSTDTLGIFQLESPGQRHLIGRLQPSSFTDLVAEISLFRPGPVEGNMVQHYVARRHGQEPADVFHPVLAEVLAETCGVIVFQEQVLRVVHLFAGFSYAEADAFRRAMNRKGSSAEMASLEARFLAGAQAQGHPLSLAREVFAQVAAFAAYGFCKAHAVAFAEITYQSAWLKAHHPQALYLGLLGAGQVGSYPPSVLLNEARRRGIPILPPHVNESGLEYAPEGPGIRLPLTVIRGVGPAIAQRLLANRETGGPFGNLEDLQQRLALPARLLATLARAGALAGLQKEARSPVAPRSLGTAGPRPLAAAGGGEGWR
ncbi:MAG: DNA polymerase III subunit alpha [Thermodesulfobacteriota bacterium]